MPDDSYELLPHEELEYLRKEVERLKGNPFGEKDSETVLSAINRLNDNINKLVLLFDETNKQMVKEWQENNPRTRWQRLYDQNEKIAKSLLSLASTVKKPQTHPPVQSVQPTAQPQPVVPAQQAPQDPLADMPEAPHPDSPAAKHTEGIFTP